jgi:hypothetical protein
MLQAELTDSRVEAGLKRFLRSKSGDELYLYIYIYNIYIYIYLYFIILGTLHGYIPSVPNGTRTMPTH